MIEVPAPNFKDELIAQVLDIFDKEWRSYLNVGNSEDEQLALPIIIKNKLSVLLKNNNVSEFIATIHRCRMLAIKKFGCSASEAADIQAKTNSAMYEKVLSKVDPKIKDELSNDLDPETIDSFGTVWAEIINMDPIERIGLHFRSTFDNEMCPILPKERQRKSQGLVGLNKTEIFKTLAITIDDVKTKVTLDGGFECRYDIDAAVSLGENQADTYLPFTLSIVAKFNKKGNLVDLQTEAKPSNQSNAKKPTIIIDQDTLKKYESLTDYANTLTTPVIHESIELNKSSYSSWLEGKESSNGVVKLIYSVLCACYQKLFPESASNIFALRNNRSSLRHRIATANDNMHSGIQQETLPSML